MCDSKNNNKKIKNLKKIKKNRNEIYRMIFWNKYRFSWDNRKEI